ncbi:RelA/SpoT domain-containing protein [Streptomyces sp. NPDC003077]|uniref:GTP pyrophosphokinase n=1 Tax=Streptomyces sp. NPDC003077 TaxID=3154443 RepID=UPI0033B283BE
MGLIEDFIARYIKEYDFYSQAARLVAQTLEKSLRASGVRCIVTHRAKDIGRLEEKCRKREAEQQYASVEDIFRDIVDLAGVRVALYFPGQQEQVDKHIERLFSQVGPRREFPASGDPRPEKRFPGYSAVHYRVQLKEHDLNELDKRYARARVEIQVASVLMHAWSEVEHDLVYKPLEGDLSEQEHAILDQLNGLVIAGELSLTMLQKAAEVRVASSERTFLNHYELAAHLLSHANGVLDGPVEDSGLGRVDVLFRLLAELGLQTPERLAPYLDSLHGNLEMRPLAEQVIDALLLVDPSRYDVYDALRTESRGTTDGDDSEQADLHQQIGRFLSSWVELEKLVREYASTHGHTRPMMPTLRVLESLEVADRETRREIDLLRRMRNNVVHGIEIPPVGYLTEATERIETITTKLREQFGLA